MARGTQPTAEELDFVYGCFAKGLGYKEVIEEYQDNWPFLRDRRTISNYRIHYEAGKRFFGEVAKRVSDPVMIDARKRHFRELHGIAEQLKDTAEYESENLGGDDWLFTESFPFNVIIKRGSNLEILLPIEEEPLLEGLKSHLSGNVELWQAFEDVKAELLDYCRANLNVSKGGIFFRELIQVPDSWEPFSSQLELVLIKGIATGKCYLCPDV